MLIDTQGSELHRSQYIDVKLNSKSLAKLSNCEDMEYAVQLAGKWIAEVLPLARQLNIRPMDIYYWEK